MNKDSRDEKTDSVFCQLKSLARRVDHGLKDMKNKVEQPRRTSDDSYVNAFKHLQDVKKEIIAVKAESQEKLREQQIGNYRFQQVLELLPQLINKQRQYLESVEEYLHNYGYVKRESKARVPVLSGIRYRDHAGLDLNTSPLVGPVKKDVTEEKCHKEENVKPADEDNHLVKNNEEENTFTLSTGLQQDNNMTPPKSQSKPSLCKTPKLEDFGLTEFTLNMRTRLRGHQGIGQEPKTDTFSNNTAANECLTPSSFKHNGLFVTPSLMNGKALTLETPDFRQTGHGIPVLNFTEDFNSPLMSGIAKMKESNRPASSAFQPLVHAAISKHVNKKLYADTTGSLHPGTGATDSPIPPLLMTPGCKQITKNAGCPAVKITAEPNYDSPEIPTLMTPGAKQIQKKASVVEPPNTNLDSDWAKEPDMPELTLSLKDIKEMSQSFRFNNSTSQPPPEVPVEQAKFLPEKDTPPLPDLLSTRQAETRITSGDVASTPSLKGTSILSENLQSASDTPPPPALLGKYSFLSHRQREYVPP